MRTVNAAHFQASRLLGLQTRNSAAYKGVMALVFRESALDFIDGEQMTNVKAANTPPDIHHIFPQAYCQKAGLPRERWNGIVNKTPLVAGCWTLSRRPWARRFRTALLRRRSGGSAWSWGRGVECACTCRAEDTAA